MMAAKILARQNRWSAGLAGLFRVRNFVSVRAINNPRQGARPAREDVTRLAVATTHVLSLEPATKKGRSTPTLQHNTVDTVQYNSIF